MYFFDSSIFYPKSEEQALYLLKKNKISVCEKCGHYFFSKDLILCRSCKAYLLSHD